MSSVRLSPQSITLFPTSFVANPLDPLDVKNSGKSHNTRLSSSHEQVPSMTHNQTSNKDQIDPQELQSLLAAIKGLNSKPKSIFSSLSKWTGPILTVISCAAAAFAYVEYTTLSNQNAKCQSDLMNATQNANLIPLTEQALFPNATAFVATAAKTLFENLSKLFGNSSENLETPQHCTYDKKESIDPVTGAITHKVIHCTVPLKQQPANNLNEPQTEPNPTATFTCTEKVTFDQYHYNMNITADCKGDYLTGKYESHEEFVITSGANGPNPVLQVEQTLCESEEVNGNKNTFCNTHNTATTIDKFSEINAQSDMLNRILNAIKA